MNTITGKATKMKVWKKKTLRTFFNKNNLEFNELEKFLGNKMAELVIIQGDAGNITLVVAFPMEPDK